MGIPTQPGGVATNAPPAGSLLEAMTRQVHDAVATLPPGTHGALVGVATTKGVNLAVVSTINDHVDITAWIGKSWGDPVEGGGAVRVHW